MADPKQQPKTMAVEVAYAKPHEQKIISVTVPEGTTIYEVVKLSGITQYFPEIDLNSMILGIFGKAIAKPAEQAIKSGDRVEIYRPLIADPKEVRRLRAEKARLKKHPASR